MHIREIVLEGFKSYATRTTVGPFDEHFNAITGLNGSGKSNILDSICFVMGITSLSQVRAQALSDFIYKQGTAGVTRASVSIMFDNRNKDQAPDGYKMSMSTIFFIKKKNSSTSFYS
jgi:structural maintenance of chromosome 2